jgi:D-ribulokinase
MTQLVIGVDIGTGSARAGVFDVTGRLLSAAKEPIAIWHAPGGIVEQSSTDIWRAVIKTVREAMALAGARAEDVVGLGFDATCSLVVLDREARPLAVGPSEDANRDIIVWMDHRALAETAEINAGGHEVLRYVGGKVSPEMQTPKLLWLKRHRPDTFARAGHFFDLSDFLTFKSTGSLDRSICTVVCKWTYLAHEARWDDAYFNAIGLKEFPAEGYRRIGTTIRPPAVPLGAGLTPEAAADLGLVAGTAVAASLIDAHAGAVGTLGGTGVDGAPVDPLARIAYIFGTSTCIMSETRSPTFVPGVWGPYFSALRDGVWLNEGGQSAAGAALDQLVKLHPAHAAASDEAARDGLGLLDALERRILARVGASEAALETARLHVLPDFLGNRSPHADPHAKAIVAGLDLDSSVESLERLYLAGLCALGYGTREVTEALAAEGVRTTTLVVSGGAAKSALVRQILADTTGLTVAIPQTAEPVLLGSAMLGAVAAGVYPDVPAAMAAMAKDAATVSPAGGRIAAFHDAKRAAFARLRAVDRDVRIDMAGF